MSAGSVVTDDADDDDVVMLEPSAVSTADENIDQNESQVSSEDTIILDEDCPVELSSDNEKDSSFARLLKNNTLMNKVIKRCLRMENNLGMSRVVNKTLMPLFSDADPNFKESEQFTALLKQILRNLKNDPDHKFLHIKSLCEELKSAKYRRKVPFVTLTTVLKNKALAKKQDKSKRYNLRNKKKHGAKESKNNKNTFFIDLDDSEDESVIDVDVDADSDDVIINSGDDSDNVITKSDDESQNVTTKTSDESHNVIVVNSNDDNDILNSYRPDKDNVIVNIGSDSHNVIAAKRVDSSQENNNTLSNVGPSNDGPVLKTTDNSNNDGHGVIIALYNEDSNDNDDMTSVAEPSKSNVGSDKSNKQTKTVVCDNNDTVTSDTKVISSKDRNKATNISVPNNIEMVAKQNNVKGTSRANSDLLVPKRSSETHNSKDFIRAKAIEKQIENYKEKIVQLEKEEVTSDCGSSPYVLCDRYKRNIVALYKKLCKLTGNDGTVMKYRVIRLQVTEGHPPGPTRRLETFLNTTIDDTGTVPLPDFLDVLKCVTEANTLDQLNWNQQQIMKEAIVLFTQCGHALRKSRQRREYKDLMHLARVSEPDDNDPANDDPQLLAKLEANKVIAKANEDEIFNRFVKIEDIRGKSDVVTARVVNVLTVNPADDSDSDSELDATPKKKRKVAKEKTKEAVDVNIISNLNKSNQTNLLQTENLGISQPTTETELEKIVSASNIKTALDRILKNAFNAASSQKAKITSSQTIINIKSQNKTNTIIQNTQFDTTKPSNLTTKKSSNTTIGDLYNTTLQILKNNTIGHTNSACPIAPVIGHFNSVTPQIVGNNIVLQNLTNPLTGNLYNVTAQNLRNTTIGNVNNTAPYNPNNTIIRTSNTTILKPTTITPYLTISPLLSSRNPPITQNSSCRPPVSTYQNNTSVTNQHTLKETESRSHLSWSNTLQKVGTSNRYIVSFDSNKSEGKSEPLNTTELVKNVGIEQTDVGEDSLTTTNLNTRKIVDKFEAEETIVGTDSLTTNNLNTTKALAKVKVEPTDLEEESLTTYNMNTTGLAKVKVEPTDIGEDSLTANNLNTTELLANVKVEPSDLEEDNVTTTNLNTPEILEKIEAEDTVVGKDNLTTTNFNTPQVLANVKVEPTELEEDNLTTTNLNTTKALEKVKVEETDVGEDNLTTSNLNTTEVVENVEKASTEKDNLTITSVATDVVEKLKDIDVKPEPEDVTELLNALGDNYMSTIFDIEDPFLVIEISSDSSSDDDDF